MAKGDIHNHNGTICKAEKGRCPFGEEGHSKDIDSYVAHHVEESGVDGDAVRSMISDGTPPADAVAVAKEGLDAVQNSYQKRKAFEAEVNEEAFGHISDLSGEQRRAAIAEAEKNLARDYAMAKAETSSEDMEELQESYKDSLAVIHGVSRDRVTGGAYGDIEVDRTDGGVSLYYRSSFRLKKSLDDYYESDEDRAESNRETYGYISSLSGTEREQEIAKAERNLAREYAEGLYEAESVIKDAAPGRDAEKAFDDSQRDKRHLARAYRESLSAIHGGSPVNVHPYQDMTVKEGDRILAYNRDFEKVGEIHPGDSREYSSSFERNKGRDVSGSSAFGNPLPARTILVGNGFGVNPVRAGWGYRKQEFSLMTPDGTTRPVERSVALDYLDSLYS